jgi:hypothetical protein
MLLYKQVYNMASWCVVKSLLFRVKTPDGKKGVEKTIDVDNPLKSLEELETKAGVVCPDDRKRELIAGLAQTGIGHTHTLLDGVNVPEWYTTAGKDDITNALKWGCELVQEQHHVSENKLQDQLNAKWKKNLDQTREDFEIFKKDANQRLLQKDSEFQARFAEKDEELHRLLMQKEKDVQSMRQMAMDNLNASGLESRVEKLKQEWIEEQKVVLSAVERERQTLSEQLEYMRVKAAHWDQERSVLQNRIEQKSNYDALMNKSSHKGDAGEQMVDKWLQTAFLGANITDTSGETGKMDRHLVWDDTVVMIDVKNHDGRLHSIHDVKKFHDNFASNEDAKIAILLCTKTYVPNHNRFWVETEIIGDDKVAVYMNNVADNPIDRLQLVVGTVIEPWRKYIKLLQNMREMSAGDELKTWSADARSVLVNGWTLIMRLTAQWTKTQGAITTSMSEFQTEIGKISTEMKDKLETLNIQVELPATVKKVRARKV